MVALYLGLSLLTFFVGLYFIGKVFPMKFFDKMSDRNQYIFAIVFIVLLIVARIMT